MSSLTTASPLPAASTIVPLCVDLDGTLVKSDTLVDSTLALARQDPAALLQLPRWLAQGKAALKQHIAAAVTLDVQHLPYNQPLLHFLREQHAAGRPLFLATAADAALARRVAEHLGLFTGVLASDGALNLAGGNKLVAFHQRFGDNYSYIGNALPDASILTDCREPMVANPTAALRAALRKSRTIPAQTFTDRTAPLKAWLRAIRLHQWAKNALIFVPLLLAHTFRRGPIVGAVLAFFAFGLCASATYIVNDLLDLEQDRQHHRKSRRPFAAGDLSALAGVAVVFTFLAASLALALILPHLVAALSPALSIPALPASAPSSPDLLLSLAQPYRFLQWLTLYALTTTAYSFRLKRSAIVDVIVLSGLYTVRILAGSAATGVPVSTWLAGFSIFFFLSLAFVKRFSEFEGLRQRFGDAAPGAPSSGRGYTVSDLEQLRTSGTASGIASVVVLTLYISNLNELGLYHHSARLWLLVPVLLLWILRLWLLASRGELNEDPVVYAITDRRSLLLGVFVAVIVLLAL